MNGTNDAEGTPPPAVSRRDRGIAAYAKIFALPGQDVPAAFAELVGPVFAEEALQAAGGAGWWHPALTARDRSIAIAPGTRSGQRRAGRPGGPLPRPGMARRTHR